MARTIAEITNDIRNRWMNDEALAEKYGYAIGGVWGEHFSKVSIESLLTYFVATCHYVTENMFDRHLEEIDATISKRAHTLNWYREKALSFQKGFPLRDDIAEYDNGSASEEEIEASKIVKKCACTTALANYPTILVKAAKDDSPLSESELAQFSAYMEEIADAGVRVRCRSAQPDKLNFTCIVYYDELVLDANGVPFIGDTSSQGKKIAGEYLQNLPYNGTLYINMLEQELMRHNGIKLAVVKDASAAYSGESGSEAKVGITDFYTPYSGALQLGDKAVFEYRPFTKTYRDE